MNINLNAIISFLTSQDVQQNLFAVRIGFFVLAGIFLGTIIFILLRSHYLQWLLMQDVWQFFTFRPFGAKRITRIWNKILRRLATGLESEYKLAVIEADDVLDAALKRMGYAGETFEEKLEKLTSATLPDIEDVRKAHEIRNNIVHNPDYRLSFDEARSTLDIYAKAFSSLQILT